MYSIISSSRIALKSTAAYARVGAASVGRNARYSSTMHDNDPETLEREKQRNLSNTQHKTSTPHEHAPGWNEHLASTSEASVKADRSTGTPEELQRQTVDYVHSRHSPEDRVAPRESYIRDEVLGPLSGASGIAEVLETSGQGATKTKRTVREETTEVIHE